MARIPPFVFGAPGAALGNGALVNRSANNLARGLGLNPFGMGVRSGQTAGSPIGYRYSPYGAYGNNSNTGYLLAPGFGGLNGYYYWTPQSQRTTDDPGPSYANPGQVRAVGELPATLQAPERPGASAEWVDARSSFNAASAKVSSARRAVEELRARLEALGQSPRANVIANTANAEAALKLAQEYMTSGNLDESLREIQRANYIAAQVLKEFGR
ncbi:MAG: hypothetical protein ABI811_17370 [Acidobacteriota bacterium]